jgi:hypothetical protein
MTVLVFDTTGRCTMAIEGDIANEQLAEYPAVVRISGHVNPDSVWYDFENNRMGYRRHFVPTISTNLVSNLPVGTKALVKGEWVEVNDGSLELEVDYSELVSVVLTHVRLLNMTVRVPCEAAS